MTLHVASTRSSGRLVASLRALSSSAVVVGVIVAVPLLLWRFVGWPLPHALPTISEVRVAIELRDFSDRLLIGTLAVVVWIAWLMTTASVVTHVIASARRITIPTPRFVPAGLHRMVGRWIGSATLLVAMLSRPATAAAPSSNLLVATSTPASALAPASKLLSVSIDLPVSSAPRANATRMYKVGPRESLWSVAEATLGDGTRWRDILDANRNIITDPDIIDEGLEITIPTGAAPSLQTTKVEVKPGDNLWSISREALAEHDDAVTDEEIVTFWQEVIADNQDDLRSGDPNLIYPGEVIAIPLTEPIEQTTEATTTSSDEDKNSETSVAPAPAFVEAAPVEVATTTPPPVSADSPEPKATSASVSRSDVTDAEESVPAWLLGTGLTGVAAASVLAALAMKRRRIVREHSAGAPVPKLSPIARTVISELRAIAKPDRITQVDRALRYLHAQCVEGESLPSVSIIRSGLNNVEFLADNAAASCPKGFALLDEATLVVDPATTDAEIDKAQSDALPLCPALVSIGSDETGDVFVDLERIGALAIEADTSEGAIGTLAHIAVELVGLPWATENRVLSIGVELPAGLMGRVSEIDDKVAFLSDARLRRSEAASTHDVRVEGDELMPPTIVLVGPGHDEFAAELAEVACQPGSGVAVVAASQFPSSHWRLVITGSTAELEPIGLSLKPIELRTATIEPELAEAIDELIAEHVPGESDDWSGPLDEAHPDVVDEFEEGALDREPVEAVIGRILEPRLVELSILGSAPELTGVRVDGKTAARADEVVTFLMLHGPACPRELGEVLWPGKRNTAQQVSQAVSRTRTLLGHEEGEVRLLEARRNAPYRVTNVGCDWDRFRELVAESRGRSNGDRLRLLSAALSLVTGTPFASRRERSFEWVADLGYELEIALGIASAAEEAAEIALAAEDPDAALAAVERGRHAVPTHENLTRLRIRALALAGDNDAVRLEFDAARRRIEQDEGLLADLDPDTQALFESVLRKAS